MEKQNNTDSISKRKLMYKCRQCGKKYSEREINCSQELVGEIIVHLCLDDYYHEPESGLSVLLREYHFCENGAVGLADFIGIVKER